MLWLARNRQVCVCVLRVLIAAPSFVHVSCVLVAHIPQFPDKKSSCRKQHDEEGNYSPTKPSVFIGDDLVSSSITKLSTSTTRRSSGNFKFPFFFFVLLRPPARLKVIRKLSKNFLSLQSHEKLNKEKKERWNN